MLTVLDAIHEMQSAIEQVSGEKKVQLVNSLVALSKKLLEQLGELNEIPDHYEEVLKPEIVAQLAAAEKRTERAADSILSAVERMNPVLSKVEAGLRQELMKEINVIFEASTFQDLVAQHLNEIKLRLEELEGEMLALQATLKGGEAVPPKRRARIDPQKGLLNGPTTDF